jgi:hypothetical protein
MSLKFSEKKMIVENNVLYGALSELDNAVITFFWVGDKPKMGSLSASLPDKSGSQLLGDRDEMISRMVGERIASKYGKIALVSTNLPKDFDGKIVLGLLIELLKNGE